MNKIAIDGYSLCFQANGIHRYLDSIISNIKKPDQIVYLFVPYFLSIEHQYMDNIKIIKCGPKTVQKYLIWSQLILPFFLFKNKMNILWSPTHRVPILTLFSNIKNVITIHDLVSTFYPKTMKPLSMMLDILFLRLCSYFNVDYIAVSNQTKEDFCKIYNIQNNKVRVISLASSFDRLVSKSFNTNVKKRFILCVGTIEPRKNHINLLIAYSKLKKEIREEFNLIIVGRVGWGNINLQYKISELKIYENVKIYNNINDSQLGFLYQTAYLTIYPSFYEGCGLPILESNGFGTPAIISDLEPMKSLCPSSSIVFNPFDTDSIANSINLAVSDIELYGRIKANTKVEIKKYSWIKSATELYESLAN